MRVATGVIVGLFVVAAGPVDAETLDFALPWTNCGNQYRDFCISGKHEPNRPVILIGTPPRYLCHAKTHRAIRQVNEGAGKVFDVTLLDDSANECRTRGEHYLAIVGREHIDFETVPITVVKEPATVSRIDKAIRQNPEFARIHESYKEAVSSFYSGPFWEPTLAEVMRLKLGDSEIFLAKYSPISSVSVSYYFSVLGTRIAPIARIWIRKEHGLRAFSINGRYFLMMSGLGNVSGYLLDVIYEITPSQLKKVYFNSDWAV